MQGSWLDRPWSARAKGAFEQELAKSGYAGPVEELWKSVDQTSPVIVTVTYTDKQGKSRPAKAPHPAQRRPTWATTVSTYYDTSDPSQILIVNVPGLGNLSGVAATLQTSGIICLVLGGLLLLAGIVGSGAGQEVRRRVAAGPAHPTGSPAQAPPGYPVQPYPPSSRLASRIHPAVPIAAVPTAAAPAASRIHRSSTHRSSATHRSRRRASLSTSGVPAASVSTSRFASSLAKNLIGQDFRSARNLI